MDRGAHSLETICLLLALKIEHPAHVHLIRGNHEVRRQLRQMLCASWRAAGPPPHGLLLPRFSRCRFASSLHSKDNVKQNAPSTCAVLPGRSCGASMQQNSTLCTQSCGDRSTPAHSPQDLQRAPQSSSAAQLFANLSLEGLFLPIPFVLYCSVCIVFRPGGRHQRPVRLSNRVHRATGGPKWHLGVDASERSVQLAAARRLHRGQDPLHARG